jgi:hypothetical protein
MKDMRCRCVPICLLIRERFLDELEDCGRTKPKINLNVRALANMQNLEHIGVHVVGESLVCKVYGGHIQTGTRMHSAQRVDRLGRKWNVWEASCVCANDLDVLGAVIREAKAGNACLAISRECVYIIIKTLPSFRRILGGTVIEEVQIDDELLHPKFLPRVERGDCLYCTLILRTMSGSGRGSD